MSERPIFRPSIGNKPDRLIGRDSVIAQIMEGLDSYPGSADRAHLLVGQRGMSSRTFLLLILQRV